MLTRKGFLGAGLAALAAACGRRDAASVKIGLIVKQPEEPWFQTEWRFAERAYLVQKLRENNWNISKTAEIIDTPRSNLYKKLEQYGIKQEVDG